MRSGQNRTPTRAPQQAATIDGDAAEVNAMPTALQSSALLGGARARVIEHRGERYFLRLTRSGKLILTK
jgi:hemin uptake protein HemP